MFDVRDHGVGFGKQQPVAAESFTDPAMVRAAEVLPRRPEPDLADPNGSTALHAGARVNAGKQLLTLLHAGVNPRLETTSGDTFQPYYFGTPAEVLNDVSLAERRAVRGWLVAHGVPLDPSAR